MMWLTLLFAALVALGAWHVYTWYDERRILHHYWAYRWSINDPPLAWRVIGVRDGNVMLQAARNTSDTPQLVVPRWFFKREFYRVADLDA